MYVGGHRAFTKYVEEKTYLENYLQFFQRWRCSNKFSKTIANIFLYICKTLCVLDIELSSI
jgi:hypothetical protein